MILTTSDKVCVGAAIAITLAGMTIKKRADRNYATASSIAKNVKCSHHRLQDISTEVHSANRALLEGNKMMRELLTRAVK